MVRSLLPVAMLLLTAATYGSALGTGRPWFGFTREWLTVMMQIEFLVIHSFAFLMLIAWFQPKTRRLRVARWAVFLAFSALYLYAALTSAGGWASVGTFLGLTAVTYLGAMLRRLSTAELILTGVRWMFNAFVFLIVSGEMHLPNTVNDWVGLPRVIEFGLWYFLALAAFEAALAWGRTAFSPRTATTVPPG